ncbi:MAG: HAMP domain-containing sensor histidine kinase [Myxococcota bacterium]
MLRLQTDIPEERTSAWSPAIHGRFLSEAAHRSARALVGVNLASCALVLLWSVGDFQYFPEYANRFLLVRIAVVVSATMATQVALKARSTRVKYTAIWIWFLPWAAESAFMIPYTPAQSLSHTFVIIIAQIGSAGFVTWNWRAGLSMSVAVACICEIGLMQVSGGSYETFAAHGYLVTGAVLGAVFTKLRYEGAREQFQQRLELAEQKSRTEQLLEEVTHIREDRMRWLENLAGFLRHEIRNQLVAVGTSLDLLERDESGRGPARYIGRARQGLGRMDRLVTGATEATSLEAALQAEDRHPINLSEIVRERVLLLRAAHPHLAFRTHIEPNVWVRGSEDRLGQMLDKLLENAVEHTPRFCQIRVSLSEQESVLLSVENEGDPLPNANVPLFQAFVTVGKAEPHRQNLGLGLFVASTIARAHEAEIVAVDGRESRGARFEVRFPTLPN